MARLSAAALPSPSLWPQLPNAWPQTVKTRLAAGGLSDRQRAVHRVAHALALLGRVGEGGAVENQRSRIRFVATFGEVQRGQSRREDRRGSADRLKASGDGVADEAAVLQHRAGDAGMDFAGQKIERAQRIRDTQRNNGVEHRISGAQAFGSGGGGSLVRRLRD